MWVIGDGKAFYCVSAVGELGMTRYTIQQKELLKI
jgi:hypothetical protein